MLDGMPLPPSIASSVLSRAHFHYTLGLRGIFLSLPLVAWMFGYPMLLGMTVIYLLLLFVWEDESLTPDIVSACQACRHRSAVGVAPRRD